LCWNSVLYRKLNFQLLYVIVEHLISSHLMIILYFGSTLQLTDSHISLLVHGVFNATISEAELKSHNYEYNESTNSW
jgi:hypothetical protein